jgi:hypothetical protein
VQISVLTCNVCTQANGQDVCIIQSTSFRVCSADVAGDETSGWQQPLGDMAWDACTIKCPAGARLARLVPPHTTPASCGITCYRTHVHRGQAAAVAFALPAGVYGVDAIAVSLASSALAVLRFSGHAQRFVTAQRIALDHVVPAAWRLGHCLASSAAAECTSGTEGLSGAVVAGSEGGGVTAAFFVSAKAEVRTKVSADESASVTFAFSLQVSLQVATSAVQAVLTSMSCAGVDLRCSRQR